MQIDSDEYRGVGFKIKPLQTVGVRGDAAQSWKTGRKQAMQTPANPGKCVIPHAGEAVALQKLT